MAHRKAFRFSGPNYPTSSIRKAKLPHRKIDHGSFARRKRNSYAISDMKPFCLELVDQLNTEEIGVKVFEAADFLVATFIGVDTAFANAVQHGGRNINLQVVHGLKGRTDGKPPTVGIGNDGRAIRRIINRRGFVTDTSTERPPIGKAKVCTNREEIGILPLIIDGC